MLVRAPFFFCQGKKKCFHSLGCLNCFTVRENVQKTDLHWAWVKKKEFIESRDAVVYLNDILIATETIEQHFRVLRVIFDVLILKMLELRLDKCEFLFIEVEYLGYRVSWEGIRPTDGGIGAIARFPIPCDVRVIRRFLRMCAYFRNFIEGFSVVTTPLSDLTRKDVSFVWERGFWDF